MYNFITFLARVSLNLFKIITHIEQVIPETRHVITGNLNDIPDARAQNIISKGPNYRFSSDIDIPTFRREIAASLNDFKLNFLCFSH